jgi:hypothetical protein
VVIYHSQVLMMATEESFDPFFNVRKGGPKEKRIRRVELMGEHKPKPIYYVKVEQSLNDPILSDETLRMFFSEKYVFVWLNTFSVS